jgi:hypothetical protein
MCHVSKKERKNVKRKKKGEGDERADAREPHKQRLPTRYHLLLCRPGHRRPWLVACRHSLGHAFVQTWPPPPMASSLSPLSWPMPAALSRPVAALAAVFKMDNVPPTPTRPDDSSQTSIALLSPPPQVVPVLGAHVVEHLPSMAQELFHPWLFPLPSHYFPVQLCTSLCS